jgi:predicted nucleotide-binding protein
MRFNCGSQQVELFLGLGMTLENDETVRALFSTLGHVNRERRIAYLQGQIDEGRDGVPENFVEWRTRTGTVLRMAMGEKSQPYREFMSIRYIPNIVSASTDKAAYRANGVRRAIAILKVAIEEIEMTENHDSAGASETSSKAPSRSPSEKSIFIVHGRDGERKHELARFLNSLTGLEPKILHEQPNAGKALIEKFEYSANLSSYAVVLLTADDIGRSKDEAVDKEQPRARQNVVFEMGFFFASLGRENVAVLLDEGVEEPGDIKGLVYIPLDKQGAWKMKLAQELEEARIDVEWKALGR